MTPACLRADISIRHIIAIESSFEVIMAMKSMEPLWTPKKPAGLYKIFLEFTDPRPVGL